MSIESISQGIWVWKNILRSNNLKVINKCDEKYNSFPSLK